MRSALLVPTLLAACTVPSAAPAPVPLRGPVPERIAVWPDVVGPAAAEPLANGLDGAVRARGYRVPSRAVGAELLAGVEAGIDDQGVPQDAVRVGQTLSVDAVLVLVARRFDAEDAPWRGAHWDLSWRLWSTRGHGLLWEHDHRGSWRRTTRDDGDPVPRTDDVLQTVPIGGVAEPSYRDVDELVRTLHRLACERLPRATGG